MLYPMDGPERVMDYTALHSGVRVMDYAMTKRLCHDYGNMRLDLIEKGKSHWILL